MPWKRSGPLLLVALLLAGCVAPDGGRWPPVPEAAPGPEVAALLAEYRQARAAGPEARREHLARVAAQYRSDPSPANALALALVEAAVADDPAVYAQTIRRLRKAYPAEASPGPQADLARLLRELLSARMAVHGRLVEARAEAEALRQENQDLQAKIRALQQIEQRLNWN